VLPTHGKARPRRRVRMISAHIAGIPVEETLAAFGPVAALSLGAIGVKFRARWRRVRVTRGHAPPWRTRGTRKD